MTSFNSIWVGCEVAAAEAARVLKPNGRLGMTFLGAPKRLGLLPYFKIVAENSPPSHVQAMMGQSETGRPGMAEAILESAGLRVLNRSTVAVTNEFPDLDTFVRAAVTAGPSFPAIEQVGEVPQRPITSLSSDGDCEGWPRRWWSGDDLSGTRSLVGGEDEHRLVGWSSTSAPTSSCEPTGWCGPDAASARVDAVPARVLRTSR